MTALDISTLGIYDSVDWYTCTKQKTQITLNPSLFWIGSREKVQKPIILSLKGRELILTVKT